MLAYVCIRGPVCMRYRSSETIFQYGYRHKCIYGCLLTADKVVVFCFVFQHKFILVQLANACC